VVTFRGCVNERKTAVKREGQKQQKKRGEKTCCHFAANQLFGYKKAAEKAA